MAERRPRVAEASAAHGLPMHKHVFAGAMAGALGGSMCVANALARPLRGARDVPPRCREDSHAT